METTPQLAQIKSGMKASWMAGDFGQVAKYTARAAEEFVARIGIAPGCRLLDVACGTGNTAIPAARAGAVVTGIDLAPNLLEQARERAIEEHVKIQFNEGDAEALPYPDAEFDVVLSMYGAMFAPRPERVASEFIRVCKPGGRIAMANWTPDGFVGQSFRINAKYVPSPPGIPAPVLWGDENVVRQRFSQGVSKLSASRQNARFDYPYPPKEVVNFFRQYFGPTQMAFSRLDAQGQAQLASELEALWSKHNQASGTRTCIDAEYLEVIAVRTQ